MSRQLRNSDGDSYPKSIIIKYFLSSSAAAVAETGMKSN